MKTFLKYFFTGLGGYILGIITVIAIVGGLVSSLSGGINFGKSEKTEIQSGSILHLKLVGNVAERVESNPLNDLLGEATGASMSENIGLNEIRNGLKKAATDPMISAIYLDCGMYEGGLATAEEIRTALLAFRKSNKPVFAYGTIFTETGYYIATAADQIYMHPQGMIDFNGLSSRFVMYKGLFDKMGVEFQVFRAGKYKSAVEPYIQKELSENNKEQIKRYIELLYRYQIKNIAIARKLDYNQLWDKALSGTIQMPADAVNAQLIDGLAYQDQQTYKQPNKKGNIAFDDEKLYSFATYAKDVDPYAYSENKIAVIYAVGEIVPGKQDPFSGIGSESFIASLKKARKDKSIKAIVIRVNSPGGSALASDEIAREIELCKKEKPLIASYGDVSASGGYYLSCVADSIVALPNTITGSIGVFALLTNVSDLFSNKLGLTYETVDLGTMSAGFRPDRPLNEMESAFMQRTIDSIYDDFLSIVSRGRKLDRTAVENLAQGHVYTAEDAKELGLVDILGGLDRAILSAARKAKLTEYRVVELPKKEDAISKLLNANKSSDEQAEKIAAKLGISTRQFKDFQNLIKLTGPQAYFPLSVEFR